MPLLDNDFVAQYDEPQASPENEKPVEEEEVSFLLSSIPPTQMKIMFVVLNLL